MKSAISFGLLCLLATAYGQGSQQLMARTASTHPMIYFVSLPKGWKAGKTWPVVVAIESADRDFRANAETFVDARLDAPFIVVVPEVVTDGGPYYRQAPGYGYGAAAWARVAKDGEWKFDEDGLDAVIADVHRLYGGDTKYYLTGWEAGCHTVFAMAFNHPEKLRAVAPVCPNYAGRYVSFSSAVPKPQIHVFAGTSDPAWAADKPLYKQTKRAETEAEDHRYPFDYEIVKGGKHGPMAEEVMAWFTWLITPRQRID